MLLLQNVEVMYSGVILVLKGVTLEVREGTIVTLLGANGAGKTTTLKAISGLLASEDGAVTDGAVHYGGERIERMEPAQIVRKGIVQVMEGRRVLQHMTVEQNLLVAAHLLSSQAAVRRRLERIYEYFPRLHNLRGRTTGYLSGGEQQMLVIGRALMAEPRLLLLDEPSLGLAPMMMAEIYEILPSLRDQEHITVLLVEQNANRALSISDYGYVMENGRIVLEGSAEELRNNEDVKEFYLGLAVTGARKSFRDVKHYKRRKRWLG